MNEQQKIEQARVLGIGSGGDCHFFARDIEGADIKALQSRVLAVGNGWNCYRFARDIKGADIQALQARLLVVGDGFDCHYFARDIEGADIQALQARVLAVGNGKACYYFARDIEGADIDVLQARIKELADGTVIFSQHETLKRCRRELMNLTEITMMRTQKVFEISQAYMNQSCEDYEFTQSILLRMKKVYIKLDKDGLTPDYSVMERSILKQLGLTKGMKVREGCDRPTAYLVSWHACYTKFSVMRRFKYDERDDYRTVLVGEVVYK